ncbi:sensor domain-containing protein [Luteipulveratus mongoliensis]|uniref:PknH-like extracellular domain-containing protein n=1 Tax=Luteipulveratus mongoliensis TaxID=571913 RepID=A0A0K1JKX9_9MICO|nr:sensor domain-containing protein [Luteipulveratus mongoliensis]AKU17371.1 hypothetical protein VV02_18460 [Luteipulveratus mongoliensis]
MPPGFAVEPDAGSDDEGVYSSSRPGCADFVRLSNSAAAPGATGSSAAAFSAGQDGPYINEEIDALGSANKVAALLHRLKSAVASCPSVKVSTPGEGSSVMQVRAVSPPDAGRGAVAVRLTASSGSLEGVEVTTVRTGVGDVVVSIDFLGAFPEDIDGATQDAVAKAGDALGISTAGTT